MLRSFCFLLSCSLRNKKMNRIEIDEHFSEIALEREKEKKTDSLQRKKTIKDDREREKK